MTDPLPKFGEVWQYYEGAAMMVIGLERSPSGSSAMVKLIVLDSGRVADLFWFRHDGKRMEDWKLLSIGDDT